jgi:hypothetical protein
MKRVVNGRALLSLFPELANLEPAARAAEFIEYTLKMPLDGSTKPLRARPGVHLSRGLALYQDLGGWMLAFHLDQIWVWAQDQVRARYDAELPSHSRPEDFAAFMAPHPAYLGAVTPPGQPPGRWIGVRATMDMTA